MSAHEDVGGAGFETEVDALALRASGHVFQHAPHHVVETPLLAVQLARPVHLRAGQRQQLVDQPDRLLHRLPDRGQRLGAARRIRRPHRVAHLRGQQRQRGAQLVRGVLDERLLHARVVLEPHRVLIDRIHQRAQFHRDGLDLERMQRAGTACEHGVAQSQQRLEAVAQAQPDEQRHQRQGRQLLHHRLHPQAPGQRRAALQRLRDLHANRLDARLGQHRLQVDDGPHRLRADHGVEELRGLGLQTGIRQVELRVAGDGASVARDDAVVDVVDVARLEQLERRGRDRILDAAVLETQLLRDDAGRAEQQAILHDGGGRLGVLAADHAVEDDRAGQRQHHPGEQACAQAMRHGAPAAADSPGRAA